ncbi:hypothetical protein LSCM1_06783 [Leishmania martiniquensis]|uniref:Uncharacterized protein n=1 Tax=Leishmania martiniquensis TaxID=1580590 RepID=A0A836KPW0_9TRYP|nr:hypothetical protein LSCM1_06783 [Leishmania martiniquensis]
MVRKEPNDCGGVLLPASMQTLLDHYADRQLTSKERLVLAQATPSVRCEALRIFFERNDASAGVEYVLANGEDSPRSHGGTSAGASRSGGYATTTTSASLPNAAASRALKLLFTNTLTTPSTVAKSHAAAATAGASVRDKTRKSSSANRAVVPVSRRTARSPAARAGSCSRRTSAALRGESVCTVVTISSMSSVGSGGSHERRPAETAAKGPVLRAENPAAVAVRSRSAHGSAGVPASGLFVPALPLDTILKRRGSNNGSFAGAHKADVLHGERPPFMSPPVIAAAANSQAQGDSRCAVPPPASRSLPLTAPDPSASASAGAPCTALVAPPPLPAAGHEDFGSDAEQRKAVPAKPTVCYANPTAALAAPVPHPKPKQNAATKGARAMTLPSAHQRDPNWTFGHHQGDAEHVCLGQSFNQSGPSRFSMSQSVAGGGVARVCGTDWAALVAAARAPELPTTPLVGVPQSPAAVPASPCQSCRQALREAARTSPTVTSGSPRSHARKARKQPKTTDDGEPDDVPAADNNSRGGGTAQQSQGTHRGPCRDNKRKARAHSKCSRQKARRSGKCVPQLFLPPPASHLNGASPIKRGVAWDEATGTYITHPHQQRRQRAAGCITAAAVLSTPRPAMSLGGGASALEVPDTLHYFARTASFRVASGNVATEQAPALLTRTPTTSAAAHAAASVPLGRLCSSALHLSRVGAATPAPMSTAAPPLPKDTKKKKRVKAPARASTLTKYRRTRKAAAVLAAPARVAAVAARPRWERNQRLCSGFVPVMYDACGQSRETIALQRPPSTNGIRMLVDAASESPSTRTFATSAGSAVHPATSAALGARMARCYSTMRGGGAQVAQTEAVQLSQHAPRSPASCTPLSTRFPVLQQLHELPREPAAGMTSARGTAADLAYQAPRRAAPASAGLLPAAQCSVFERLTSNYYEVYSSAAALQAAPPPSATLFSQGGHSARKHQRPARLRRRRARLPGAPQVVRRGRFGSGKKGEGEQGHTAVTFPRGSTRKSLPGCFVF